MGSKRQKIDNNTGRLKIPMWHIYRVELFPHYHQGTGVIDKFGYELKFPSLFRLTREDYQKGIIKIKEGRCHD